MFASCARCELRINPYKVDSSIYVMMCGPDQMRRLPRRLPDTAARRQLNRLDFVRAYVSQHVTAALQLNLHDVNVLC